MTHPPRACIATSPFLLLSLFVLLPACSPGEQAQTRSADTALVEAIRPAVSDSGESRSFDAVVRPRRSVDLAFRQGGRMAALRVQVGQIVAAGEVIARLAQPEAEAAADQALGEEASARADLRQAEDAAARVRGLGSDGTVAAGDVSQRRFAADAARARLMAAQARLRQARATADEGLLLAPADGVITEIVAEPGTVVSAGIAVVRIATGASEVELRVPEDVMLKPGATAAITFWNRPGTVAGRLRAISPQGDALRMRKAWFTLPATAPAVPFGSSATVTIADAPEGTRMRVPLTALGSVADAGKGANVWALTGDGRHVRPQPVRIIALRGEDAIVAGLKDGTPIVASGTHGLRPGQAVTVVEMLEGR
ncbi:efflux RND transporter periplasmic adaptor subunit [Sphingobium sp. DC-2]|uniref:efflux RND transporter periplasmic adaptor subunit n=1 Tax=Sphingobium sp. DC-2 TaxID=1303256 RepID=UPI000690BD17|nr:efflux RND transporter periplasmic adaptor subunit [Sphingobium sp. DC-2]